MEQLLDLSKPTDVSLLDATVVAFLDPRNPARKQAENVLEQFQQHPDAWTRVDQVLETSTRTETKFMALKILEELIKFRWRRLPAEQRDVVRQYLVQKIIALSQDEATLRAQSAFVKKLNLALVQVLKHEWPANWPSFIPDIVSASKTSEVLCENNMGILKLLSEEVFDFSKESMTAAKAEALKSGLKDQFQMVFELCEFILQASQRVSLVVATLETLQRFVTWVPDRFIFETALLPTLCSRFLPVPHFRVDTLMVLIEVSALVKPQHDRVFEQLFVAVMEKIVAIVPAHINIKDAFAKGSEQDKLFIRHLALFLTTFFKAHAELLEKDDFRALLMGGMDYLVKISDIDDGEIFKICLEYWQKLAQDLYALEMHYSPGMLSAQLAGAAPVPVQPQASAGWLASPGGGGNGGLGSRSAPNARKLIFAELLSRVREVMINHMQKPEEVLIEEDETGEIVREQTKDTEALAVYKNMKDTIVFLTHLDPEDTEKIMLDRLSKQVDGSEFKWDRLNTLSWSIGSISGTMSESDEKRFLVTVIKDLLGLCEQVKGKDNKAVVASSIMYVVGQYPRFLRAHWKFLKTVVIKLFEFMHEKHPGVQDMAVDTFLKISQKCRKKFVQQQPGEPRTFCEELCANLPNIIADLETHQVLTFYEAAGCMVSAHPDLQARYELTERLLGLHNGMWKRVMTAAKDNVAATLGSPEALKELQRILRINTAACKSIGPSFDRQLGFLYLDMLRLYEELSRLIQAALASGGAYAAQSVEVKAMRAAKKESLVLVSTFIGLAEDPRFIAQNFIPPLLGPVLQDYQTAAPATRDPEVLNLLAEIVNKLKGDILGDAPRILEAVFEPTLQMITANFQDFPEHRMNFFRLLEAINAHCFSALFKIRPAHTKLVVDSVVWAFKHTARDIGETGLNILEALLTNVAASPPELSQSFFMQLFLPLVHDLLEVLTDRLHKAHFKQHATILQQMFHLVESGRISVPLWESPFAVSTGAAAAYQARLQAAAAAAGGVLPPGLLGNPQFVRQFVRGLVASNFANLSAQNVQAFVDGLFDMSLELKAYKAHLRDFLVQVLEFGEGDEAEAASAAVAAAAAASAAAAAGAAGAGGAPTVGAGALAAAAAGRDSLFAEERAAAAAQAQAEDLARRRQVPGLLGPYAAGMGDEDL